MLNVRIVKMAAVQMLLLLLTALPAGAYEVYVSPDGNDANSGTIDKPFAGLEAARDAVREFKASNGLPDKDVIVYLRGGKYQIKKTFELNEKDSGSAVCRIIYKAYRGEAVSLTGGVSIDPAAFEPVSDPEIKKRIIEKKTIDKIYQVNLKALGITDYGQMKSRGFRRKYKNPGMELFINDQAMRIARWPNSGFVKIGRVVDKGSVPRNGDFTNRGGTFHFNYDRANLWRKADNLYLSGNFATSWADDTMKVEKIDFEKKTFKMAYAHIYGISSGRAWTNYFALNLLEEIDAPGEWYLDRANGIAYVYPDCDIKSAKVEVSLLDEPMVAMEGCNYVTFEGITFEVMRDMAVYIERGCNNLIAGCVFRNIGLVAVCMGKGAFASDGEYNYGDHKVINVKKSESVSREISELDNWLYVDTTFNRQAGHNNGVLSCDIYNIGAGAIHLGGGDRKTLIPGNNYVKNCEIYDYNRLDRSYKSAVNVTGAGNIISYNHIHDAPDMAIYLHGNDHIIEYNHVHHVMLENNEGGWFYMGRDLSELGIVIRYNFVHHVAVTEDGREGDRTHGASGIYLDDNACGADIYGNVLFKTGRGRGAILYKDSDVKVRNNIFIECERAICARAWMFGKTEQIKSAFSGNSRFTIRLNAVNYLEPPYIIKYPFIKDYLDLNVAGTPRRDVTERNVFVKMNKDRIFTLQKGANVGAKNNYITDEDPGFVDADNLNFQLKDDSVVYKKIEGFEKIPFEQMGLYNDKYRKNLKK